MSLTLLVMTDGRDDLLAQTVESAMKMLRGTITRKFIHSDNGDEHVMFLRHTFPDWAVIGGERLGFGGAINRAWTIIAEYGDRWIAHVEDDFIFNRPVSLPKMQDVMEEHPYLIQMCLRRQPWNEAEKEAGGIVEMWPDTYEDKEWLGNSWLEHRNFVSSNPALWQIGDIKSGWPDCEHSEAIFSARAFEEEKVKSAFWGKRDDAPWVEHIGNDRAGHTY